MKIRSDFVTNSSSATFVIPKKILTQLQKHLIYNHIKFMYVMLDAKHRRYAVNNSGDEWEIIENQRNIYGSTSMDNFDMQHFLIEIGLKEGTYKYTDHDYSVYSNGVPSKAMSKSLKKKYSLDIIEGSPCQKCLVGITCQKEFYNKTACTKYYNFLKKLLKDTKSENKNRLRNK